MRFLSVVFCLLVLSTVPADAISRRPIDRRFSKTSVTGASVSYSSAESVLYDGIDEYCTADGALTGLQGEAEITFSWWMKHTGATTNHRDYIFSHDSATEANGFDIWSNRSQGDGSLQLDIASTAQFGYAPGNTIPSDDAWHHYAIRYDGGATNAERIRIFVDGSEVTNTIIGTIPTTFPATLDTAPEMADHNQAANPLDGNIDEFAIILSIVDPTELYNGGSPGDLTSYSPLHWWKIEDPDTIAAGFTDFGSGGIDFGTCTNMESADLEEDAP